MGAPYVDQPLPCSFLPRRRGDKPSDYALEILAETAPDKPRLEHLGVFARRWIVLVQGPLTEHAARPESTGDHPVWGTLELLKSEGLLSFVPHLWTEDSNRGDIIHAYGIAGIGGEPAEIAIGEAAHNAGFHMIPEHNRPLKWNAHLAPVKSAIANVCMIGIARLRYRPHTRHTAAWFANLQDSHAEFCSTYAKLFKEPKRLN